MVQALNRDTGQVEELDDASLPQKLLQGNYALPKGTSLPFFDPVSNERVEVAPEDVVSRLQAGFQHVGADQLRDEALEQEYGNRPISAAVLGAGRGLSFGLSDLLATKVFDEETIRELEERNKAASIAGEVASLLIPVGEASALVKGAQGIGKGVAKATLRGLGEKASSSLVKEALKKATAQAAGSAAEGAAYGVGHLISEDALGRADLNAENIISSVGLSAILGGAIGAGFSGAGSIVDAGTKQASKGISKAKDTFKSFYNRKFPQGATPEEALTSMRDRLDLITAPADIKDRVFGAENIASSVKKDFLSLEGAMRDTISIIDKSPSIPKEVLKDTGYLTLKKELAATHKELKDALSPKDLLSEAGFISTANIGRAPATKRGLEGLADDAFAEVLNVNNTQVQNLVRKFYSTSEKLAESAENAYNFTRVKNIDTKTLKDWVSKNKESLDNTIEVNRLQKLAKGLQDYSSNGGRITDEMIGSLKTIFNNIDETAGKTQNPIYETIKSKVGPYITELETKNAVAPLGSWNRNLQREQGFLMGAIVNDISDTLGIGSLPVLGAIGSRSAAHAISRNPVWTAKQLLAIERGTQNVRKRIGDSVSYFMEKAKKPDYTSVAVRSTSPFYSFHLTTKPKAKETQLESFDRIVNDLDAIMSDGSVLERIQDFNDGLAGAAPKTTTALGLKTMKNLEYLYSQVPRQSTPVSPFDKPSSPSKGQIQRFQQVYSLVVNPVDGIEQMLAGDLSNEEIHILERTSPELYQETKEMLLEEMYKNPSSLTYQQKLLSSVILGMPLATGLNVETLNYLQKSYSDAEKTEKEKADEMVSKKTSINPKELESGSQANNL